MIDQNITSPAIQIGTRSPEKVAPGTHVYVAWGVFILCILLAALSIYKERPPNSVPASAIATDFSSGRALRHVETISRNAHPIGSVEHARVSEYILGEVAALGEQHKRVLGAETLGGSR